MHFASCAEPLKCYAADMRAWAIMLFAFGVSVACPAAAADIDYSIASPRQLIDALTLVDCEGPGLEASATFSGFIAEDKPLQFRGGLMPVQAPCIPAQMREIVRRGVSVLPTLIQHLGDARPARLSVGMDNHPSFGGQYFNNEYDPRYRYSAKAIDFFKFPKEKRFETKYVVRVGDICFSLIGQIVNRRLLAVRYQPSLILFINSPIRDSTLIRQVKTDWDGIKASDLEQSLLADVRQSNNVYESASALQRLRFYFPEAYAGLTDADLDKRDAFEAYEKSQKDR